MAFPTGAVEADPVLAAEVRAWLGGERGPDHPPTRPAEPSGGAAPASRRGRRGGRSDRGWCRRGGPRGRRRRGGRLAGRADRPPVVGRRWAPVRRGTRRPDLAGAPGALHPHVLASTSAVGRLDVPEDDTRPGRWLGSAALVTPEGRRHRGTDRGGRRGGVGRRRHGPAVVRADPASRWGPGPRSSGWPPPPLPASAWGCWSCGSTLTRTAPGPTPLRSSTTNPDRTAGSWWWVARPSPAPPTRPGRSWRRSAWPPAPACREAATTPPYLRAATVRPCSTWRPERWSACRSRPPRPGRWGVAGPWQGPAPCWRRCGPRSPRRS